MTREPSAASIYPVVRNDFTGLSGRKRWSEEKPARIHYGFKTFTNNMIINKQYLPERVRTTRRASIHNHVQPLKLNRFSLALIAGEIGIRGASLSVHKDNSSYTGIVCVDFDDVPDPEAKKAEIQSDPYVALCFVSPSGRGLKIWILSELGVERHKEVYLSAIAYFERTYELTGDPKCTNVNRLCFISYDPDFVCNEVPRPWSGELLEQYPPVGQTAESLPVIEMGEITTDEILVPQVSAKGTTITSILINPDKFAHLIATHLPVLWDESKRCFRAWDPDTGIWQEQSRQGTFSKLLEYLTALIEQRFGANVATMESARERTVRALKNAMDQLIFHASSKGRFAFKMETPVIHLRNGSYYLNSEQFVPGLPIDCFATKRVPCDYDPNATAPKFSEFLQMMDPSDAEIVQMYFGQCLLGANLSQTILLLTGPAATGKSALVTLLRCFLNGEFTTQLRTKHLDSRFEYSGFIGKNLLIASDVPSAFLRTSSASMLKSLTGGDSLTCELKGETQRVDIKGQFNVIITSNAFLRPENDNDADAWQRRLLRVLVTQKPNNKIAGFADILFREEGPGILNWLIAGLKMLRDVNWDFSAEARGASDPLDKAINEFVKCKVIPSQGASVSKAALVERFKKDYPDYANDRVGVLMKYISQAVEYQTKVQPSNDIRVDGGCKRGYHGLTLAAEDVAAVPSAEIEEARHGS